MQDVELPIFILLHIIRIVCIFLHNKFKIKFYMYMILICILKNKNILHVTVLHFISMIFQTKYLYYIYIIFQGSSRSARLNTFVIACYIYSGVSIKVKRMSTKLMIKYLPQMCLWQSCDGS